MKQIFLIVPFILISIPLFANKDQALKIKITSNEKTIIFELNDSDASKEFIA